MSTLSIDSYQFIQRLTASGVTEKQAEAIMNGLKQDVHVESVATSADITDVKREIELLRRDFETFKVELFKWLVPLLLAQGGFIVTLVKLL